MNEDFIPKQSAGASVMQEVYDWVEAGMVAVVFVVLMFTFVVRMAGVEGHSMNPTLMDQDKLLVTRMGFTPSNGDIVVVTKPNSQDEPLIKRVIAVEGQQISIDFDEGYVYLNGNRLDERYVNTPTNLRYDQDFSVPLIVPKGHVFVMGDNRNNSWDSRDSEIGMVDERYILGKVIYRIIPYDQMGIPR